nr:hypothetical protein [Tanacetum cinerariifolium]
MREMYSVSKMGAGDNESFFDVDVPKHIYSNPLFDEEIISNKIDPHHFNAEFDLIESLLNQDSSIISSPKLDSLLEEFSGELAHIDLIPSRIDEAGYDHKEEIRDIIFLEELLSNDSPSLPKNESFYFDVPSSPRPPAKPPDDGIYFDDEPVMGILTVKVVGDISKNYVLLTTQPTLVSNEENSPHLLSHRGFKSFQLISESPIMIYGENIPTLDVLFLHFYPP